MKAEIKKTLSFPFILLGILPDGWDIDYQQFIKDVVDAIWNKIKLIPEMVVDEIANRLGSAWDFLVSLPSTVSQFINNIVDAIFQRIMQIPGQVVDVITTSIFWLRAQIMDAFGLVRALPPEFAWTAPILGVLILVGSILIIYWFLFIYENVPFVG